MDLDTPNKHINRDLSTNMKVDKTYHSIFEFSENSQYFKKKKLLDSAMSLINTLIPTGTLNLLPELYLIGSLHSIKIYVPNIC